MKKIVLVFLALAGVVFTGNSVEAQVLKIGVFDVDIMVQAMPGYRGVDSLLQIYEQDSLKREYDFAMREYNRLDSTYKSDSAAKAPGSVLNYVKQQRNEIATTIIYWQQISQRKTEGKRQELAGPLFERVIGAYDKVLKTNNYLVVLKPGAYEMGSKVENVFEKVAKEIGIPLPENLRSQGTQEEQPAPAAKKPAATPAKPAAKKP